ncbi:MAG: DUF4129 domain-containing protein [Flavobacteriales bacterium]|nr:MAG: DUF4129 domain-containing protein [Flavobacteriales bacterium]
MFLRSYIVFAVVVLARPCAAQQGTVDSLVNAILMEQDAASGDTCASEWAGIDTLLPEHEAMVFDDAELAALRAQERYQYERDVREAPNWWDHFWEWVKDWFSGLFNWLEDATGWDVEYWFWDNIWLLICGAALVLVAWHMRKRMFSAVFGKAPAVIGSVRTLEEDITADDLPQQLAAAEQAGEWRRALRLQYLLVLRHLVDTGAIEWKPERTDRDYQDLLREEDQRQRFARLSFIFKWVWYGEALLDRNQYERLSAGFQDFRNRRAA